MHLDYHTQTYGVTRSGKTKLALRLLMEQPGLRLFVDTKSEDEYHTMFHLGIRLDQIQTILANLKYYVEQGTKIMLSVDMTEPLNDQLNTFAKAVFLHQRTDNFYRVNILIDELQEYVSTQSCPQFVRALIIQGLSKNIRVIFTSQRWGLIPKNVRNNCENLILLKALDIDVKDMMEQGLLPYDTNDRGWKVPKVKFDKAYTAYMQVGLGGTFTKIQ